MAWYPVLIVVLLFGVVWLILFRNKLKTRATEVWNYLKNSTQSIKNCIGMLFESESAGAEPEILAGGVNL